MKKFLIMMAAALLFTGCATMQQSPEEMSEAERLQAREQEMGEKMLEAFRLNNFEEYIQFIPRGGRQEYPRDKFAEQQQQIRSSMGEIVSWRFLGRLELEPAHRLVWAVRFKNHDLQGNEIFKEALFTIVVGQVDDTSRVFLFGFI